MKTYKELKSLFLVANKTFLRDEKDLFSSEVSERCLCGSLMLHLNRQILKHKKYEGYYTDVEYNRNRGNIKTIKKTVKGANEQIISVTCDLIIHSRGNHPEQDNLIALEMKKSNSRLAEKKKDRERLMALTKDTFDDVWSYDGITLPEHVCGYVVGIYYEINFESKEIYIEYYKQGEYVEMEIIKY